MGSLFLCSIQKYKVCLVKSLLKDNCPAVHISFFLGENIHCVHFVLIKMTRILRLIYFSINSNLSIVNSSQMANLKHVFKVQRILNGVPGCYVTSETCSFISNIRVPQSFNVRVDVCCEPYKHASSSTIKFKLHANVTTQTSSHVFRKIIVIECLLSNDVFLRGISSLF